MPYWIPTPTGPAYVDENGNPVDPATVPLQQQTDLTGGNAPAVSMGAGSAPTGAMPSPEELSALGAPPGPPPSPTMGSPAQSQPAGGAVPSPGFTPPQPGAVRSGQSFGTGESGFSPVRHGQVLATQGRLGQSYTRASDQAAQGSKLESDAAAALAGDYAHSALDTSRALADQETARASEFREQARLASMFAAAESTAAGLAAERTSAYRARYEQSLQAAAAMSVKPGLDFSAGEGVMAAGALFAQGFLNAKGVPVADVSGIINKMVDRNIALQQDKIRRGERLAEGQRQLWEMARVESSDDSETRQRMRGLMLAQAAASMEASTAQFGSKLALAKGQESAAAIRADLNKQLSTITDRYFTQYMKQSELALDQWKAEMTNSQESRRLNIAQQEVNQKANIGKNSPEANLIFDVTKSGKGRAIAKFLPGTPPEKMTEIRIRSAKQASFLDRVDKYHVLADEAGKVYGGWGKALANDDFAKRAIAWRNGLVADYTYAKTGAQSSEPEAQRHASRIPLNATLDRDGANTLHRVMGDMEAEVADAMDHEVGAVSIPLSADEAAGAPHGAVGTWGRPEALQGNIRGDARGEKATEVKNLLKAILSPTDEVAPSVSDTWLKTHPSDASMLQKSQQSSVYADPSQNRQGFRMPTWAPEMERLHDLAADPWGGASPQGQDAWSALTQLEDSADDAQQRQYARQLKDDIVTQRDAAGLPRYTVQDFLSE